MTYIAEYTRPYENGYVNLPSKETPEMAEFMNKRDDTLLKIEAFLKDLDLSSLGKEYALLSEAGYSLDLSMDDYYVLTISLKNKAGTVLSSKSVDLPIESMIINVGYDENTGILTMYLQNGQTLDVNISSLVRGLVPDTRTIAGLDLKDDITKEELQNALNITNYSVTTTELILTNSYDGTLKINEIGGASVLSGTPSINSPADIKGAVINKITTKDDNGNTSEITLSEQVELHGIGDSKDIITQTQKRIRYAVITLNGSEAWAKSVSEDGHYYITGTGYETNSECISNMFSYSDKLDDDLVCRIGNAEFIQVRYDAMATLSDFKNFLASNNLVVLYKLAEEIVTDLPYADQEALQSLKTFNGTTYIEFDSEITPTVSVTYPASEVLGRLDALESTRNLKTYTNLKLIGMSIDNTIDEVMAALPNNSELQIGIAKTTSIFTSSLPFTFAGGLTLTKYNNSERGEAKIYNSEKNEIHTCGYFSKKFSSWVKISSDLEGTVLWVTTDTSAEFAAQTITISEDISNYEYYEIEYCRACSTSTNISLRFRTGKIKTSMRTRLTLADAYNHFRQISEPSGTSMTIADSNYFTTYGATDTAVDNKWLIPIRVIGYKKL